jgi:hypothetical protein
VRAGNIVVEIEGAPTGLVLKVDGVETTAPVQLPMGDTTHLFELEAPGFVPQRLRFDAKRSRVVTLAMQPQPEPPLAAEALPTPAARTPTQSQSAVANDARKNEAKNEARNEAKGATKSETKSNAREEKPRPQRPHPRRSFRRFDDI